MGVQGLVTGVPGLAKDRLPRVILGTVAFLTVLTLAGLPTIGGVGFKDTEQLGQLPWLSAATQSFIGLSTLAFALLCFERYRALGNAWTFWTGIAYLATSILDIFYLLAWPGLMGQGSVIARLSNTATWLGNLALTCICLIAITVRIDWPMVLKPARALLAYLIGAATAIVIGVLAVVFEDSLPALIAGSTFTPLALLLAATMFIALLLAGTFAYRRHVAERDAILGYLSLSLFIAAFALLFSYVGGKRYDTWWYAGRITYILACTSLLVGYLQEGYAIFAKERHRVEERERLLEQLRSQNERLQAQSEEIESQHEELVSQNEQLRVANEEQARARHATEEALMMRDEFLSVAAHELKTPVANLRVFAQLLLHKEATHHTIDPERFRRALEVIDRQSDKLARLVTQLLDISRLEGGRLSIDRQAVDLVALVTEVAAATRLRTEQPNIRVEAPAQAMARLDPLRVEQVITNLVDNAVRYSPDGGEIRIQVSKNEDGFKIQVRDHGIGIPPEHRQHVFERFYRAHAAEHVQGLGLGLYVSAQIAALHGGQIELSCPEDGGAEFTVFLPSCQTNEV